MARSLQKNSKHDIDLMFTKDFEWDDILAGDWDVIWSLHCTRIFPERIIDKFTCINIHPGFNPCNRGHAPQVFSLMNGKPCGVTVHLIDKLIDNGAIIHREEVPVYSWDTSFEVYNRIQELEEILLAKYFDKWTENPVPTVVPTEESNLNYKKDFNRLCELDLKEEGTMGEHINRLRAFTHGSFKNAYFIDEDGNKVFVQIKLIKDEQ